MANSMRRQMIAVRHSSESTDQQVNAYINGHGEGDCDFARLPPSPQTSCTQP